MKFGPDYGMNLHYTLHGYTAGLPAMLHNFSQKIHEYEYILVQNTLPYHILPVFTVCVSEVLPKIMST